MKGSEVKALPRVSSGRYMRASKAIKDRREAKTGQQMGVGDIMASWGKPDAEFDAEKTPSKGDRPVVSVHSDPVCVEVRSWRVRGGGGGGGGHCVDWRESMLCSAKKLQERLVCAFFQNSRMGQTRSVHASISPQMRPDSLGLTPCRNPKPLQVALITASGPIVAQRAQGNPLGGGGDQQIVAGQLPSSPQALTGAHYSQCVVLLHTLHNVDLLTSNRMVAGELCLALRKARSDGNVQAVVLRIDSPGLSHSRSRQVHRHVNLIGSFNRCLWCCL